MTEETFTTGELSARTGLSLKAIRVYESRGLLTPARVDAHSGRREYGPEQLRQARQITLLRGAGMPLADIASVLELDDEQAAMHAAKWWAGIRDSQNEREWFAGEFFAAYAGGSVQAMPVVEDTPEQPMVSAVARVTQEELLGTFDQLARRLRAHVLDRGARPLDFYEVRYHGMVSPDSDGPIEVVVSSDRPVAPAIGIDARIESAGHRVRVDIPMADCHFPRILAYFTAAETYLADHGLPRGGATAEHYQVDTDTNITAAAIVIPLASNQEQP